MQNLAEIQKELLASAVRLVEPEGELIYSICTVTKAETNAVVSETERRFPSFKPIKLEDLRCRPYCYGLQILPHDSHTDGMTIFKWKV